MNKTDFIETDYKNRFNKRLWLEDRRRDLIHYFATRNIVHGDMGSDPHWQVVPRTSIWEIKSIGTPGFEGWFGIAGDHPTDVVPLNYFDGEPRRILEHFVNKWLRASSRLKQGEDYGDFRIERIDQRAGIGELIEDRALRLKRWVDEDELWQPYNLSPIPAAETVSEDSPATDDKNHN